MASFVNACVFTAASSGTGSFVVSSAVTGWQTPAQAGAVNSASYRYRAYSSDLTEWEIGTGTYTSGTTTLTRTVSASSNGGGTVNFTAAPTVALTSFAEDMTTFTQAITPATNDGAALGTGALSWSDLYLASGGAISFDSGDVTITHSANYLQFSGASSGYGFGMPAAIATLAITSVPASPANGDAANLQFNTLNASSAQVTVASIRGQIDSNTAGAENGSINFYVRAAGSNAVRAALTSTDFKPTTNDMLALGTGSLSWSDLFLASGAVINFNNGDVTVTHSANTLAFAGASSGYTFDANVATTGTFTKNGNDVTVGTINYVIDGGGSAITTGSKGFVEIPFACTVNDWTIVADQSGSIVVDVKRATYANFPTTASIAGSEKPTLSSVQKNQDTSLSTWTTSIAAGDILEFVVDSATTVTRVTLALQVTRA